MNPRLPDRRGSRVLLIGASRFTHSDLHDLPAVSNNVHDLSEVLTAPDTGGFDRSGCRLLIDPETPQQVGDEIETVASEVVDTLVVYYAGHGLLNQRGELYLAVRTTNPDSRKVAYSGVPMQWFRSALADSPARNRILILDSCFSGHAATAMSAATSATIGALDIHGTYTVASAPPYSSAVAPVGARFTAFTGALIGLLRQGIPDGEPYLALGDIFPPLARALLSRGMPQPQQLNTGLADRIALIRNVAYRPVGDQRQAPPERSRNRIIPRDRPADDEPDQRLVAEFHRAMLDVYRKARKEAGYNATFFLKMVEEMGGLKAAQRLLQAGAVSSGFTALWEKGRLDLSVEAVVLQDRFARLFTDEELDTARDRLTEYGYARRLIPRRP